MQGEECVLPLAMSISTAANKKTFVFIYSPTEKAGRHEVLKPTEGHLYAVAHFWHINHFAEWERVVPTAHQHGDK